MISIIIFNYFNKLFQIKQYAVGYFCRLAKFFYFDSFEVEFLLQQTFLQIYFCFLFRFASLHHLGEIIIIVMPAIIISIGFWQHLNATIVHQLFNSKNEDITQTKSLDVDVRGVQRMELICFVHFLFVGNSEMLSQHYWKPLS